MVSAVLALFGALVYGSADFLGGLAARRMRSIVVTCVAAASGLLGLLGLLVALPLLGGKWLLVDIAWGTLAGVFGVLAVLLLYACLAIGPMSILSPLTAVVSAIAPMLWGLLVDGESLALVGYAGLGVALVAVVLVGFVPGAGVVRPSVRGVVMAIGSGACIGAFLIVIDQTSAESGVVPLLFSRAANLVVTLPVVVAMIVLASRRGVDAPSVLVAQGTAVGVTPSGRADLEHVAEAGPALRPRVPPSAWMLAAACGVVDAAANALMLVALRAGDLAIVSALTALYPAGTILLAAVVLRERIAIVQGIGLVLALVAGGMLALA